MRESHVEGVATHDDPEPCIYVREDVGEAWDRGTCGPGIEPRNAFYGSVDAVIRGGRLQDRDRLREILEDRDMTTRQDVTRMDVSGEAYLRIGGAFSL